MRNSEHMQHVYETRRENLRLLIGSRADGVKQLAQELGYSGQSFLSQMAGPNPVRNVSETTARAIEQKLGLPAGWLDTVRG
jgi:hypothetical protein